MKIFIDIITDTRWDCFVRTKSAGEVQIRRHHQLERLLCHLWTSLLTEPRLWCNKAPPYDLINQGKNQSERPPAINVINVKNQGHFLGCLTFESFVNRNSVWKLTLMVLFIITIQKEQIFFDLWTLNTVTYYINSLLLNCEPLKA